jgi:hypothetical protein
MDYRLPIPQNWQDFESICHRLWMEIWSDTTAKKHGRQGQPQHGVDIFGKPIYNNLFAGVQCKDKNGLLGSVLKAEELLAECDNALKFQPKLNAFTMATTSPRDAEIQKKARELTLASIPCLSVDVWFWDDIQAEIIYRPSILEYYYKGLPIPGELQNQVKLSLFSPKDKCAAFFSRPNVETTFNSKLKKYLISLAYELKDNSFRHGGATHFSIVKQEHSILFIDNGKPFNILENMDPTKVSEAGHIGGFILHDFLQKFKGSINSVYRREVDNESEINILEFEIDKEAGEILKEDFIEIEMGAPGSRDEAARLAASVPIDDEIKEIIWNMTNGYGYALSFSAEFLRILLLRIKPHQKLILYTPRDEMFLTIAKLFNDSRLDLRIR